MGAKACGAFVSPIFSSGRAFQLRAAREVPISLDLMKCLMRFFYVPKPTLSTPALEANSLGLGEGLAVQVTFSYPNYFNASVFESKLVTRVA